jgi:hypothetical protein
LNLSRSLVSLTLVLFLAGCSNGPSQPAGSQNAVKSQAPQAAATTPSKPAAAESAGKGRIWTSQTTGKEYRVWIDAMGVVPDKEEFHAEWTNIPPEFAAKGAFIRTVCERKGPKWVGKSQEYLPCSVGTGKQEHIANFCRLTTGFELDSMTATLITGRTEALKRFDCAKCQVLEKEWKSFVWVPKK